MLLAAAGLLVVLPASAQALGLSNLTAAPASPQAGAHSNFHIHMDFSGGQVKDLTIGLPPGLVGDPNAAPLCTVAQLNAASCAPDTAVGSVTADAQVSVLGIPLPVPITASGSLYNLTPQAGEPARFGIVLNPLGLPGLSPIILQSAVQLRPDYGLNTVIANIPNTTLADGDTTIISQDITLFGTAPGTGKPFMRNPTSCEEKTTNFSAVPYSGGTDTGSASFTTTGCGNLDFSPTFTARVGGPGQTAGGLPTTAVTSIDQDTDEAGLIRAVVNVPSDFNVNAGLLGSTCPLASFQAGACSPASVVGSAIASSPLLSQPLSGPVVLVAVGGPLPDIGLDLQGQLHLLLRGTLDINKTTTFDGLPDIPIAHFQLTFTQPPGLLGNSRDLCVPPPPVFHAAFQGYNGASTSADVPATVEGCGPGAAATKPKCKAKKKRKHRAAEAKKKHKKKSCKKRKRKKRR